MHYTHIVMILTKSMNISVFYMFGVNRETLRIMSFIKCPLSPLMSDDLTLANEDDPVIGIISTLLSQSGKILHLIRICEFFDLITQSGSNANKGTRETEQQ